MQTAKLFQNGQSQAVRLPKAFRFEEDEVGISRMGELVILYPRNKKDALFFSSLGNFTEDYFDSIASARAEYFTDIPRESFDTTGGEI